MPDILVTICARGGSKGVKGKNIRPLNGKPLIYYTIKQALQWDRDKHVIVSTDSNQIAEIARQYGAKVPFLRPEELALDTTPKINALRHALNTCEEIYKEKYDVIVDLDVTSPVRTVEDIERCYQIFKANQPKSVFSVVPSHRNPYFNMVEETSNDRVKLVKTAECSISRRQDAPCVYDMNASINILDRRYVADIKSISYISDHSYVYVMDQLSGVDIDSELDFKFVEFLVSEQIVRL